MCGWPEIILLDVQLMLSNSFVFRIIVYGTSIRNYCLIELCAAKHRKVLLSNALNVRNCLGMTINCR